MFHIGLYLFVGFLIINTMLRCTPYDFDEFDVYVMYIVSLLFWPIAIVAIAILVVIDYLEG